MTNVHDPAPPAPPVKKDVRFDRLMKAWLAAGGPFPESIVVEDEAGRSTAYTVLDRDEQGRVGDVASRAGQKGFILRVRHEVTEMVYAAKVCLPEEYEQSRSERDEAKLLATLSKHVEYFSLVRNVGRVKRIEGFPSAHETLVCFISDWVDGKTLRAYLKDEGNLIDKDFVLGVASGVNRALNVLSTKKLRHNDLHTGNVMIERWQAEEVLSQGEEKMLRVRVIDAGSLRSETAPTNERDDDRLYFVKILAALRNKLFVNRAAAVNNVAFLNGLDRFIEMLLEEDHQRSDLNDHKEIQRELDSLKAKPEGFAVEPTRLSDPFEVISAEQLSSDELLLKLYTSGLSWYPAVSTKNPNVVTGPRGCGKSMVFRHLAIKTHLSAETAEQKRTALKLPFIGVYVSCASEFQNSLGWVGLGRTMDEERDELIQHREGIVTYFQLVLLRELLRTVALILRSPEIAAELRMSANLETELCRFIESNLPDDLRPMRFSRLYSAVALADALDRARFSVQRDMLAEKKPQLVWPESFLGEVTSEFMRLMGDRQRPIAFILDDFTQYRIPLSVQRVVNRVLWERRGSHIFKISCEQFGFEFQDLYEAQNDPEREFVKVDIGAMTLVGMPDDTDATPAPRKQARRFVEDLIDTRLEIAGWEGKAASLIGNCKKATMKGLAESIRKGEAHPYHGLEVIADLFCGDVATVLQLVRTICQRGSVGKSSTNLVNLSVQHDAIVEVSNRYIKYAEQFHPYGDRIAETARAFTSLMFQVLKHGKPHLPNTDVPRMIPRIEITLDDGRSVLNHLEDANPEAEKIARQCLRRSLFFELSDGRPKNQAAGGLRTVRWEIRRIYVPQAGAAFGKNHYFDVTDIGTLANLFVAPSIFVQKFLAMNSLPDAPAVPIEQLGLI